MFKNTASQKLIVFAFDTTNNSAKTGDAANLTAYVSKDYGAVTVLTDTSATEMDATNAKGYYLFDLAQAETNADTLLFSCKSATANIAVIAVPATVYTLPATGILAPTTAGRTLDVSAGGEAGLDWANIGSPTTTVAFTGTTIATTQKVDIETIKTNPVVNAGTVTFPTTATLASTTNITAGTMTTTTNLTNLPSIPANWLTAAGTAADFGAEMATAIWTDTTAGDFTVAASIGKSVMNGVALGTGLTINAYTGNTPQTGDSFARIGATGSGLTSLASQASVDIVDDFLDTEIAAIKAKTDQLTFTVANKIDANTLSVGGTTQTAGDLAAMITVVDDFLDTEIAAIKAKTDQLTFTAVNQLDCQVMAMAAGTITAAAIATDAIDADALAADAVTEIQAGLSTLTASGVRTAVGLASANLDTQLSAIPTAAQNATAVLTTQMTEGYAADGVAPTLTEAMFMTQQAVTEASISGTTLTVKKLDGTTAAATFTLNDATSPTSRTRAT